MEIPLFSCTGQIVSTFYLGQCQITSEVGRAIGVCVSGGDGCLVVFPVA